MGPSSSTMTSADSLSLILRRLDEIERKLDRMMKELRPTAIGYSARRGNLPKKDCWPQRTNVWREVTKPDRSPCRLTDRMIGDHADNTRY
jgi:hypothetical protein